MRETTIIDGYAVKKLDLATGNYIYSFGCPKSQTTPSFSELNAAGIGPYDSMGYAALTFNTSHTYLVRFGPRSGNNNLCDFRYLARIYYTFAASFDSSGTFLYVALSGIPSLWTIGNVNNMAEHSELHPWNIPDLRIDGASGGGGIARKKLDLTANPGADIVTVSQTLGTALRYMPYTDHGLTSCSTRVTFSTLVCQPTQTRNSSSNTLIRIHRFLISILGSIPKP